MARVSVSSTLSVQSFVAKVGRGDSACYALPARGYVVVNYDHGDVAPAAHAADVDSSSGGRLGVFDGVR